MGLPVWCSRSSPGGACGGEAGGSSRSSVLLRLLADSFITRGADISYLSAFPSESEYLYPPLAYLKPARTKPVVYQRGEKLKFVVIDVVPYM